MWICTTWPSFPLSCRLLFNYFYSKISSFMPVLSTRIVLHSFESESESTWIWRLLFVVNVTLDRVCTLFWTKTSRTFQGLSRTHFPFSKDSIQCRKEPWVYIFLSSTTAWAILSWSSFISGTWESGLDKVSTEIQGLSSTDYNFQGLSRPWTFYFKFQGFSRCVRTLLLISLLLQNNLKGDVAHFTTCFATN